MNGSVECLRTTAMRSHRVAQTRVGHKNASNNKRNTEYTQHNWSPNGTPTRAKNLPESNGEAECKQSADEEVGYLHPSQLSQAKRTSIIVPRIVAWARSTFDQNCNDKE